MGEGVDWDQQWRGEPFDREAARREERTPRWRAQERLVQDRFGSFRGLRVIEVGAGRGLNALLYAKRGADVTLLDTSDVALGQARQLFAAHAVGVETLRADVLRLPAQLQGRYDVSMSFGLCEHFVGEERARVVAAHLELLRAGGVAFVGVPNRFAPFYRLWKAVLMARGTWPLGTEEPFSRRELAALAAAAGGHPLEVAYGSFVASAVDHGVNQLLFKVGLRGLRVPQIRLPLLDRFAYELMLPVVKS